MRMEKGKHGSATIKHGSQVHTGLFYIYGLKLLVDSNYLYLKVTRNTLLIELAAATTDPEKMPKSNRMSLNSLVPLQ